MSGKMNLAVIGCGGYAGYLIERLFDLKDICQVVAVTTSRPESETARNLCAAGVAVYKNMDALLRVVTPETCQAIVIPTSIESHFEYAQKAVRHGFHVMLEKPPVATVQDLDRLIELQRRTGRFIAENFQHLFSPMTQQLKKRLGSNEFGAVLRVRASALWSRPESYFCRSRWSGRLQVDGRLVLDGTIGNPLAHLLAEALYLATPEPGMAAPVHVRAELYHANDIESEDTSCLLLKTDSGVSVLYCAALTSETVGSVLCEIETEQAFVRLKDYSQAEIVWRNGQREQAGTDNNGHLDRLEMLKSFIEKLSSNEKPLITVEECRPYLLAWNGAFESVGIPRKVNFDDVVFKETAEGPVRAVYQLDSVVDQALRSHCLFSDLGVNWASSGNPIDLAGYHVFPSIHPELIEIIENKPAVMAG